VGRFGPYIVHDGVYKSLTKDDDVLVIGMNRAMELLSQAKGRAAAGPLKTLGEQDGKPVTLHEGRYGPYVSRDGVHATLPKDTAADSVTLEQAVALIAAKAAKGPAKKAPARKAPAKKATAEKATAEKAEKPAAKKAPAKKASAKKAPAKAKKA
jgi:DNA topoisomerase-1